MNGNMEEQLEEVSQDNYASSSDPEIVSISSSSDTESELEDILIEENAEEKLEDNMFEPLCEGANISISGAYCAIMESLPSPVHHNSQSTRTSSISLISQ